MSDPISTDQKLDPNRQWEADLEDRMSKKALPADPVTELRDFISSGAASDERVRAMVLAAIGEIERLSRELAEVRAELGTLQPWRTADVATKREELGGWRCDHCQEWNRWGQNDGNCTRCSVTRG